VRHFAFVIPGPHPQMRNCASGNDEVEISCAMPQ
jgi:hypothetical protein